MITDEQIQQIIDSTDIVSLVSEHVELTKKGSGYFGLCPFHNDSSPSFSVSPDKKIAKCMSCGEGGNPISFLRKVKNISFVEAASILAQRAGIAIDVNIAPKKEDKNKKKYEIYQVAQEFYTYTLFNTQLGKKALEYLHNRGLTEDTIKMFGIGLAPNSKDTLKNVLIDKGYLDLDCIEIGLLKNNNNEIYDVFTNRIMFPIKNENGQTIAFSGRVFSDSSANKYVNTMETVIYRKGDHLYNLSNAIPQINRTKTIVLCEGQMDVIKVSNTGLTNVVCALGSALTANQVKLIKKYASNVVLAYDNDSAGIKATITAINLLNGLNIDVIQFPEGFDPDEYISKNSVEKFNELYSKKINSIEFIYNSHFIGKNLYSLVDVENIKNEQFKFIKSISSNTIKEKIFNKLAVDLKINYESLLKDFNSFIGKKDASKPIPQEYMNNIPPEDFGVYDYGDYNNHSIKPTQPKVVENTLPKQTSNKSLIDASRTLIALALYDKNNVSLIIDLLDGRSVEEFLVKPYLQMYAHLTYLYLNGGDLNITQISQDFLSIPQFKDEFLIVIDIVNNFKPNLKVKILLQDCLLKIEEKYREEQILKSNPIIHVDPVQELNEKLKNRIELDKVKVKNIKK